jgi:hypothetical protein
MIKMSANFPRLRYEVVYCWPLFCDEKCDKSSVRSGLFPHDMQYHRNSFTKKFLLHAVIRSIVYLCFDYLLVYLIILPVVLYGCETWSLTLREERRLRVLENRVLRRVFGHKRDEVTGNGENYIMRSLVICTPYPILCGW